MVLDDRLRDATAGVKAVLAEVEVPPIGSLSPASSGFTASIAPRRGWLVAATSAAAVVLLVGLPILVLWPGGGGTDVVETPPATTTSVPETTVPPTAAPTPVAPMPWVRIPVADHGVSGTVDALTEVGGAFVAAGVATDAGRGTSAVWTSEDGTRWQRAGGEALAKSPLGDERSTEIRGLAVHDGRLVAVGVDVPADGASGNRTAAIWYSTDGSTWNRVGHDPAVFAPHPGVEINAVEAHFNAGFVAVGSDAWTSRDGIFWDRHDIGEGTAFALVETDDGILAGGTTGSGDLLASDHAVVWMSTDIGETWSPTATIPEPAGFDSSVIRGMTRTDDGFVAVGFVGRTEDGVTQTAVWSSEDGFMWGSTWIGDAGAFRSVAASPTRLVAVGDSRSAGVPAIVWHSADGGATWVEDADEGNPFQPLTSSDVNGVRAALGVSTADDAFILAGHYGPTPTVWLGGEGSSSAGDPGPTTTTTAATDASGWTCQARIDNGAIWLPGEWDDATGTYVMADVPGPAPAPCVDILEIHSNPGQWKVTWDGTIAGGGDVEGGFQFVFEQGIHGTVYEEKKTYISSGEWITEELDPDPSKPFTFVAMPHSFDDWESITFTITPCATSECG